MVEKARRTHGLPRGPMQDAALTRGDVVHTLLSEEWLSEVVSPAVAACMLGIDDKLLSNRHMSILFHQTEEGIRITAGTTRKVAMQAFHEWRTADTRSQNSFYRDAYKSLYRLFQAAAESAGDMVYAEMTELFVAALGEEDKSWMPFLDRIRGYGDIAGEADERIITEKMQELWQKIPQGMQSSISSISPEHMFGG